jgi:hypothetical protein
MIKKKENEFELWQRTCTTHASRKNMLMLTFDNSEDIDTIHKVTHILGCKVEIQPMR